jgi:hypothetical protein
VGLFGYVGKEGIIKNVGLENVKISSTGDVVGGLIGDNEGTVSNCYSTGSVKGVNYVGGLIGYNYYGKVSNSYSTGSVKGVNYVGGLIGDNVGTVSNCYSTGSVNGYSFVGGLIGYNAGGTASNSFWDIQTSGLTKSAGGTGKTTEQMKNVRTYTDILWSKGLESPWDFVGNPYDDKGNEDIWDINPNINNGYPYLTASISTSPSATTSPATSPATGAQTITRIITSTITTTITQTIPSTIPTTTTIIKEVSYIPTTKVVTERPLFSEESIALGIALLMILTSTVIGIWLRRRIVS